MGEYDIDKLIDNVYADEEITIDIYDKTFDMRDSLMVQRRSWWKEMKKDHKKIEE